MWRVKIAKHFCWVFLWALFPLLFLFSWVYIEEFLHHKPTASLKFFCAPRKQKKAPKYAFPFLQIIFPPLLYVRTTADDIFLPPLRLAVYPAYISRNIVGESSVRMWTGQGRKKKAKKGRGGTLPGAKLIITPPDLSSRTMVFPAYVLFFIKKNLYGYVQL